MGMAKRRHINAEANYARENGRYPDKIEWETKFDGNGKRIRVPKTKPGSVAGPGTLRAGKREAIAEVAQRERLMNAAPPAVTRQQVRAAKRQSGI